VAAAQSNGWNIELLDRGRGIETFAHGVNDRGDVVGEVSDGTTVRAAVWRNGVLSELGPLSGYSHAKGWSINKSGQVAGYSMTASGQVRATFWDADGRAFDVGTLGGVNSRAFSLNDQGEVVGTSDFTHGSRAFSWSLSGGIVDRGNLNPESAQSHGGANAINNNGVIVGTMYTLFSPFRAVFAGPGEKVRDMAVPGRSNSEALGINDAGVMVGYSNDGSGDEHAAIFDGRGGYTDLGVLANTTATQATDINNNGWIVGRAIGHGPDGIQTSFLYRDGQMVDLMSLIPSDSGWEMLFTAESVSDAGFITGTGIYQGETRAFRMAPVPEPATLVGVSIGAIALVRRRRR